jgi:2-oxoglutarate ferredoxin oxidoreductase subunit beta
VVQIGDVALPACKAWIQAVDLKSLGIRKPDWALASLAVLAYQGEVISPEMLTAALKIRFKGKILESSLALIKKLAPFS